MCYDIKTSLEVQLKRAKKQQDLSAIEEITEKLAPLTDLPLYHASGFNHPEIFIYTNESPYWPIVATWGLVPHWVKTIEQQKKIWNSTLNARGETLFEKPSFRDAIQSKRCIISVDGFYEHHHYNGQAIPFYIEHKKKESLTLAGIWSEWINPENGGKLLSFAIVTTKATGLMAKLHNNPKLDEPRMPLILTKNTKEAWLGSQQDPKERTIKKLISAYSDIELVAHPVAKLRGKSYLGNTPLVTKEVHYDGLKVV